MAGRGQGWGALALCARGMTREKERAPTRRRFHSRRFASAFLNERTAAVGRLWPPSPPLAALAGGGKAARPVRISAALELRLGLGEERAVADLEILGAEAGVVVFQLRRRQRARIEQALDEFFVPAIDER